MSTAHAFPAPARAASIAGRIGVGALALFALFSVWQTAPANTGLGLALLAALIGWAGTRSIPFDTASKLAFALAAWILLRGGLQAAGHGEAELVRPLRGMMDWLWPLAFLPLATLPAGDRVDRVRQLWLLSMLGFAVGIVGFLYTEGLAVLWSGARLRFHLDRPLGMGLYAGSFFLVAATTWRAWWHIGGRWRWSIRLVGLATLVVNLEVLITTQNRTTYLGLLIVAAAGTLTWLVGTLRRRGTWPWRRLAAGTLILLALGGVVALNGNIIQHRIGAERNVVGVIESDGLAAAPASSITVRLRLWRYVLERAPDAPLLGHGFGGLQDVIDHDLRSRVPLLSGEHYDHVHNSYLQTLWSQGLIGVALWAFLIAVLLRDVARAARHHARIRALMPAVWSVLGFTAVWACFDYRLSHPDMRCFVILMLMSLRLLGDRGSDLSLAGQARTITSAAHSHST